MKNPFNFKSITIDIRGPKMLIIAFTFLFLIIIVAGWFYWFEYRPSKIRIECGRLYDAWMPQQLYYDCLHERGIDK